MPTRIEFAAKQYDINLEALGTVDFNLSPSAWEGLCSGGSRPVFTAIENCCNMVPV
jgi:hypothetical protein